MLLIIRHNGVINYYYVNVLLWRLFAETSLVLLAHDLIHICAAFAARALHGITILLLAHLVLNWVFHLLCFLATHAVTCELHSNVYNVYMYMYIKSFHKY